MNLPLEFLARQALAGYGIDVEHVSNQSGATLCKVFKASTTTEKFGIKIYPSQYRHEELETEILFAKHLERTGLSVTEFLTPLAGDMFFVLPDGRKAAVYRWVEGEIREAYDRDDLYSIVATIALIHEASSGLELRRDDHWLWIDTAKYLSRLEPLLDLKARCRNLIQAGRPWLDSDVLTLCHGDYTIRNIVWRQSEGAPTIIDFTNAIWAPREWDLAGLCADVCLLGSLRDDANQILAAVSRQYAAETRDFDSKRLERLFPMALVQRAIFDAYTSNPERQKLIWQIVARAL